MNHRIAVLASGRGSNFQALLDAIARKEIPATCTCLITDNPRAFAIERAKKGGVPVKIVDFASFRERGAFEEAIREAMREASADLYVLCGYMRLLDRKTVQEFRNRIINIHPALLPSFRGLHAQRQAVEYGVKVSGCTVHFVDEEMDAGPIILQACVPVKDQDDENSLAERILEQEHRILPEAVRLFCQGRLVLEGRRVRRI